MLVWAGSVPACDDDKGESCTPQCDGPQCGEDGCGGTCGTCEEGASCQEGQCEAECTPDCAGRECGDDGCGGDCGPCPGAAPVCSDAGVCKPDCQPDCEGKECGDDGCSGDCGLCPGAAPVCSDAGVCEPDCQPSCEGRECGDDGCDGDCGNCEADFLCSETGKCEPDCEVLCMGKQCGPAGPDDDCQCGACGDHETCSELSTCICAFAPCGGACCPEGDVCFEDACCTPDCEDKECGDDGCGGSCGECGEDQVCGEDKLCLCAFETCEAGCCAEEEQCFDGACCTASCDGLACGDDGCGGSCGECGVGTVCSEAGACVCEFQTCGDACCPDGDLCFEEACCPPDCADVACGDDGCGGSCGECLGEWAQCEAGACVEPCPDLTGQWVNVYLAAFEGECYGETEENSLVVFYLEVTRKDGEYVISEYDKLDIEPTELTMLDCAYDLQTCSLGCVCDDGCVAAYYEELAAYWGDEYLTDGGQIGWEFAVEAGKLAATGSYALTGTDDSCDYLLTTLATGSLAECESCDADAELLGTSDCLPGHLCLDYTEFPGNGFCSPLCQSNLDCGEGFFCPMDLGFCQPNGDLAEDICVENDVYFEDVCGATIGPVEECGKFGACGQGACHLSCDNVDYAPFDEAATYSTPSNYWVYQGYGSEFFPTDVLGLEIVPAFGGPEQPGVFDLGEANYKDCGVCLLIAMECKNDGSGCEKYFYPESGTLHITELGGVGGTLAATITDANLSEVTIDPDTYESSVVDGGTTWCLEEYSFSATLVEKPQ